MDSANNQNSVFFAFASKPEELARLICDAISKYKERNHEFDIRPWTNLNISGSIIWEKVRSEIDFCDYFFADISTLNQNVVYELGYAIGRRKKIRLVLNENFGEVNEDWREHVGILDSVGHHKYNTKDGLCDFLESRISDSEKQYIDHDLDKSAGVYLFEAYEKNELTNHIKTSVKKLLVRFRSYDPQENSRLPVHEAIQQVAISEGVVVSFIPENYMHSITHNFRAAFIAGLSHGMDKELSIIQVGDTQIPLDFRDFTSPCYNKEQIGSAIEKFTLSVIPRLQKRVHKTPSRKKTLLEQLDLGSSVAENEIYNLDNYYHEMDSFQQTFRGEARLIIGRKGAGKTALFFRIRDEKRKKVDNVVLDLKPEGYKFLKFKETIVDVISEGSLNHIITAIWEYALLLEIAFKILERDKFQYARNSRIINKYENLKSVYEQDNYYSEGDFSERVSILLDEISENLNDTRISVKSDILSQAQISELIYRHPIHDLNASVADYLVEKNEAWVLIDNLDKGWPGTGVTPSDIILINCLLDALGKISHSLGRKKFKNFYSTVFLRADVYDNLVDSLSDRGKLIPVSVDWTDKDALKEMVRKRFVYSNFDEELSLDEIWENISTPVVDGKNSLDLIINQSLYRPRVLLDLLGGCKSFAVNRRHDKISEEDIKDSIGNLSIQMIENINLELRDINPKLDNFLYQFVDKNTNLNINDIKKTVEGFYFEANNMNDVVMKIVDLLLWFGFFGIKTESGAEKYIFDVNYNMRMMNAIKNSRTENTRYVIHPAFRPALDIA